MTKTALFHRQFLEYSGGHGKVWDYFNHVKKSGLYEPRIFFTSDSIFNQSNPWLHSEDRITADWNPEKADLLFLAGMDWQAMPPEWNKHIPIINLIQGVRHADPRLPLYGFLRRPAIRICVSQPIADAILSTREVQGPVYVIPNGLQLPDQMSEHVEKGQEIFISAVKNVPAGISIAEQARRLGYTVDLLTQPADRIVFLKKMQAARIAILLSMPIEGFYLPGLEAMALGTPVIMPDCIGNREYARHEENCLICTPENMVQAIHDFDVPGKLNRIRQAGFETAQRYTLSTEYNSFIKILWDIESIYQAML